MPCRFFSAAVKNSLKNSIYLPTETFIHSILYSQQWPDDNDPCIQVREWKPTQLEPSHSMSDPLEFCLKASSVVLRHLWGGIEKKRFFQVASCHCPFLTRDREQGVRSRLLRSVLTPWQVQNWRVTHVILYEQRRLTYKVSVSRNLIRSARQ